MKNFLTVAAALSLVLPLLIVTAPSATAQDAAVVDSAHYKVELETDDVRVLRIKYGPGEESVMHYHPESVVVSLTNSTVMFTLPDSSTMDFTMEAGSVSLTPAGAHQPKNTGDGPLEVLQIELKKHDDKMYE